MMDQHQNTPIARFNIIFKIHFQFSLSILLIEQPDIIVKLYLYMKYVIIDK